jgi:hypothetical protein
MASYFYFFVGSLMSFINYRKNTQKQEEKQEEKHKSIPTLAEIVLKYKQKNNLPVDDIDNYEEVDYDNVEKKLKYYKLEKFFKVEQLDLWSTLLFDDDVVFSTDPNNPNRYFFERGNGNEYEEIERLVDGDCIELDPEEYEVLIKNVNKHDKEFKDLTIEDLRKPVLSLIDWVPILSELNTHGVNRYVFICVNKNNPNFGSIAFAMKYKVYHFFNLNENLDTALKRLISGSVYTTTYSESGERHKFRVSIKDIVHVMANKKYI